MTIDEKEMAADSELLRNFVKNDLCCVPEKYAVAFATMWLLEQLEEMDGYCWCKTYHCAEQPKHRRWLVCYKVVSDDDVKVINNYGPTLLTALIAAYKEMKSEVTDD